MHVRYSANLDHFTLDGIVNSVWKTAKKYPANISVHYGTRLRGLDEKLKRRTDCGLELIAETRSLRLVP